ncbi:MAG TPA: hopanoid-associated sugar epimerase [Candidatus Acidoferrales bacterium]|jgi:dihydroflavonol-4-reductase|nr:hopanoid-associated sugar epimerase [Candidatus Acidoferrales bacterium]
MTTLVTGATGFLGSHVARQLVAAGHSVRVLIRSTSNLQALDGWNAERVVGDLQDGFSLARAMKGVHRVFHVAADYRLWTRNPNEIYETNVGGTRRLLDVAGQAGVERFVYTSTVATIAVSDDPSSLPNEQTQATLRQMIGHYKRSKFMAELEAIKAADAGLPVVIVNPTAPVGPGDWKPTPTGRIIVDFLNGKMPAYVDTGLNLVPVEDAAAGHLLAAEKGRIGERYILGGRNMTLKQILDALASISGRSAPRVRLPHAVALAAGYAEEFLSRLSGREPRIPVEGVKMSRHRMFVESGKAERELGFKPGAVEPALERAVRWYGEHGYLRGRTGTKRVAHAQAA